MFRLTCTDCVYVCVCNAPNGKWKKMDAHFNGLSMIFFLVKLYFSFLFPLIVINFNISKFYCHHHHHHQWKFFSSRHSNDDDDANGDDGSVINFLSHSNSISLIVFVRLNESFD